MILLGKNAALQGVELEFAGFARAVQRAGADHNTPFQALKDFEVSYASSFSGSPFSLQNRCCIFVTSVLPQVVCAFVRSASSGSRVVIPEIA